MRPQHNDATTEKWAVKMLVGTGNLGMPQAFQFGPVGRLKTEACVPGGTAHFFHSGGANRGQDASYVGGHTLYTTDGHWHKLYFTQRTIPTNKRHRMVFNTPTCSPDFPIATMWMKTNQAISQQTNLTVGLNLLTLANQLHSPSSTRQADIYRRWWQRSV